MTRIPRRLLYACAARQHDQVRERHPLATRLRAVETIRSTEVRGLAGGRRRRQPGRRVASSLDALRVAGGPTDVEVMEVAYSDGRRLLLPLSRIDQIQRYSGIEGVSPRLDRLGGSSWVRTKEKVKRSMQKLASDLVRLYAERQLASAPAMGPESDLLAQFEAAFDFEETEDQLTVIQAIKEDLELERPMDRLLCGDVGFGKTEVAMRAAFKVVEGGFQVAVLAPPPTLGGSASGDLSASIRRPSRADRNRLPAAFGPRGA